MSERQDDAHDQHMRQVDDSPASDYLFRLAELYLDAPEHSGEEELLESALRKACKRAGVDADQLIEGVSPPHRAHEIMRCPVLTTGHLSHDEAQRRPSEWPTHCHESEHGFVVYFGTLDKLRAAITDDVVEQAAVAQGLADLDEWPGLLAVAAWAEKLGFEWVRFDQDGPTQDDLPEFEW